MSANQDAAAASSANAQGGAKACPLKKNKIQLLPVRYALVEQKTVHPAIASNHAANIKYRPVGIRLIDETSYLYLIHSKRPDIIHAYQLAENGVVAKLEQKGLTSASDKEEFVYQESDSTIVVSRSGSVQVLYSRTKISPKLQGQLLRSSKLRQKMMQSCQLGSFDCQNGSRHLLPPEQLEKHLAEVHPQQSTHAKTEQWCWLTQMPKTQSASVLTSKILPAYQGEAAILLLEDPIGLMTELASAYQAMVEQEEQWMAEGYNRADYFAAAQLLQLIEMSDDLLLMQSADNQKLAEYSKAHPNALENRYRDYWKAKQDYEAALEKMNRPSASPFGDKKTFEAYRSELAKNDVMAKEAGVSSQELKAMFDRAGEQKEDLLYGESWMGMRVARGILERIDEEAMRAWYGPAQAKMTHWRETCFQLETDRVAMLPAAYTAIPVYDKEVQEQFKRRLDLEYHWLLGLGDDPEHRQKVSAFFATLGEQTTHLWVSNADNIAIVEDYDGLEGDINNALGVKDSTSALIDGLAGLKEFQAQMAGMHLKLIDSVPAQLQGSLSRLASELGRLAIPELQKMAERIHAAQGQADSLLRHARPGTVAMLLGQAKNAAVTLDIGTQSYAGYTQWQQKTLGTLETLRKRAESATREYNKASKSTPTDSKIRARANAEWAEVQRESAALREQVFAHSQPVARPGEPHPVSHIVIKASGATLTEIEEHLHLSRAALRNQVLFGNAARPALGGATLSGSLGLVVLVANWFNFAKTAGDLAHKSENTGAQNFDLWSATLGLMGAALALSVEVVRTSAYCRWLKEGAESSLKAAGRVVTLGTTLVAVLGTGSALFDGYKQASQIGRHWRRGEWEPMVASAITLSGDGLQAYASGKIMLAGTRLSMAAIAGEISWQRAASVTLRFAVRFNPYMWLASALIFGGELAYNFLSSTPLMRWVSESRWGKRGMLPFLHANQEWEHDIQLRKWQEVMQIPRLRIKYNTETKMQQRLMVGTIVDVPVQQRVLTQLRILLPMTAPEQVKLAVLVKSEGKLVDFTDHFRQTAPVAQEGLYTRLDFDWPQDDVSRRRMAWLHLVLSVTTAEGNQLFEEQGGLRFSLNLQQIQGLEEATLAGDEPGWSQVEALDEDDNFPLTRGKIVAQLQPLLNR